jgi:hypothetical protein
MRAEAGIDMTCKEAYLSDAEFEKVGLEAVGHALVAVCVMQLEP